MQTENHAQDQARAQLESIAEMVKALREAEEAGDNTAREQAEQTIHEDPLSVEVRSGWYVPGGEVAAPEEFQILLCTGGPAVRIRGTLGRFGEPDDARLEYQDWFTPWQPLEGLTAEEGEALLDYCRRFYFGE